MVMGISAPCSSSGMGVLLLLLLVLLPGESVWRRLAGRWLSVEVLGLAFEAGEVRAEGSGEEEGSMVF